MSSLNALWWKLKGLDIMIPGSELDELTYHWTYNESLGFKDKDLADFSVFIPYRNWPEKQTDPLPTTQFPSALQEAFISVLQQGSSDKSKCLIDLTSLNVNEQFFTQPEDIYNIKASAKIEDSQKCLARRIADVVNAASPDAHPVVRILCGTEKSDHNTKLWSDNRQMYEHIFWRQGEPLITHKNAVLQVGYYSPEFDTSAPGAKQWIGQLMASVQRILQSNASHLKSAGSAFDPASFHLETMIGPLLEGEVPSISWNHAKILAVNGQTMMTGGGNYWYEYIGGQHAIIDHQVKIKGDAAISAHRYCDYFWKYLNKDHQSDKVSFQRSIPFNTTAPDDSKWSTATVLEKNPFNPTLDKSKIPVLTVGRLGDWYGKMNAIPYPVQMVDAVRDILLNALWYLNSASSPAVRGEVMYNIQYALHDDPKTEAMFGVYRELQLNPLAWASRIARYETIANAQRSVHISQQMLVDTLQVGVGKYKDLTDAVNSYVEKQAGKGLPQWDGAIWPYDMFVAFGWALNSIKKNNGEGIYIVLTTHKPGGLQGGWEDKTSASEFTSRLKTIMKGMSHALISTIGGFTIPESEVDKLVDEKFHILRVLKDDGTQYCHNKIVVVDRKMMYVGSDNMYPSYNEEHGVWIEEKKTIDAWFGKFWEKFVGWSVAATD